MRLKSKTLLKLGGLGVANIVSHWMSTLEYRAALSDVTDDPAHPDFRGPVIFAHWHEYIPFLFYLRGHCNVAMLVSQHQDAEFLSQAARHMGFRTVRGSSNRGGVAALRELFDKCQHMNLAITPDGPRGPRRQLAQGAVYLSSKLQIPLIPVGLGYDRPYRVSTWDSFAVPRLYSRARAITGARLQIPPDLSRNGIEHYRQRTETLIDQLTTQAEDWATGGYRLDGEVPLHRQSRRKPASTESDDASVRLFSDNAAA